MAIKTLELYNTQYGLEWSRIKMREQWFLGSMY